MPSPCERRSRSSLRSTLRVTGHRTTSSIFVPLYERHGRRSGADWSAFMAANWSLHERIAAITPNSLARGIYLATISAVAELPVHPQTDNDEDAANYLSERTAIHAQLVEAIASGDADHTRAAVDAHRGISIGSGVVGSVADTS